MVGISDQALSTGYKNTFITKERCVQESIKRKSRQTCSEGKIIHTYIHTYVSLSYEIEMS